MLQFWNSRVKIVLCNTGFEVFSAVKLNTKSATEIIYLFTYQYILYVALAMMNIFYLPI
jgi:hypothetical protein